MKAGFASRNITPHQPMLMGGFDRRTAPSNGVLDPLAVCVLALQDDQGQPFLFCVFDLLGTDSALCTQVKKKIGSAHQIPPARIWVSATHTHSAPTGHFSGRESYQKDYVNLLLHQAAAAAAEALEHLEPVTSETADASAIGVASLRNRGRDGADFPMPLLAIHLKGQRRGYWLTKIACHPTVLDEHNTRFSRDLPGQIRDLLGQAQPCVVLNGACADISTRFTRRSSDSVELQRLGAILGKAAAEAPCLPQADFGRRITAAERTIALSRSASLGGQQREALLSQLQEKAKQCTDPQALREYDARIAVLERAAVGAEKGRQICISAVDLGPYVLLGLPFEVDHADGQALEQSVSQSVGKAVYLVCYTGGYDGYLPSGAPLTAQSSYEDFASRYLPESREQVWECAKQCVLEAIQAAWSDT